MASIREFIVNKSLYGIPEFQRTWNWHEKGQVEDFFDSIFRGYPLPRFFMWKFEGLGGEIPVSLNKFSNDFNKRKATPTIPFDEGEYNDNVIAVCDGQQRLTSLIIGLQGIEYDSSRTRQKYLYWDLLATTENRKRFEFLDIAKVNEENILLIDGVRQFAWIKVKEFYDWASNPRYINPAGEQINLNSNEGEKWRYLLSPNKSNLSQNISTEQEILFHGRLSSMWRTICTQNYLDFVDLSPSIGDDLSEAVEFFLRINGKGKPLDPNQLLFALLARYLENNENDINLKSDFESINMRYGGGGLNPIFNSNISYKFILRVCLYLESNTILFKLSSFNQENCNNILNSWVNIKGAIIKTFEYIGAMGIGACIKSLNSIIPVIYHFYRKNITNIGVQISSDENRQILKYIINAQLSKVFGSHSDNLLQHLKNNQVDHYHDENAAFNYNSLIIDLPQDKNFDVEDKIEELLNIEYGNPYVYPILNLLYGFGVNNTRLDIDHIHPKSICTQTENILMFQHNCNQYAIINIQNNFNKLSNLQLLKSTCNQSRNNRLINQWIDQIIQSNNFVCLFDKTNKTDFLTSTFIIIPEGIEAQSYLSISNFETFYDNRKSLIRDRLRAILL
jgi:hypothetical protein